MKMIEPNEFREWNEGMIKKYDPDSFHHHSNLFIRFIEKKRVKIIINLLTLHKEDRLLEIGCGAGNVIEKAPRGKLYGVDISSYILNKAKQRQHKKVFLFQGDAQNLPCKDQIFSNIICSEVLEHVLNPLDALHEMSRILKTNGVAIISIPNESLINCLKRILVRMGTFRWFLNRRGEYQQMPQRMNDEWHLHSVPLEGWLDLFHRFFKVTRLRRVPFLWLPLRYVLCLEKSG
jgi:ubiquinone/menaquinone biosynthesis C-methylase UbiE